MVLNLNGKPVKPEVCRPVYLVLIVQRGEINSWCTK